MATATKQLLFTVSEAPTTALGFFIATNVATPGSSAAYTPGKLNLTIGSMGFAHWNALFHYDPTNKELHALGKDQSPGNLNRHAIFPEADDAWRDVRSWTNTIGHAYCLHTLDPATGDLYFIEWNDRAAQRYQRSSDAWISNTAQSTANWGTAPNHATAWHPDLFGAGDGGLVSLSRQLPVTVYFWRKATNLWSSASASAFISVSTKETAAAYSPALGAVICGGGDATQDLIRVNSPSSIAEISAAPCRVGAWTSATGFRSPLTAHPVSGKPMILGREGSDSGKVWIYEAGTNSWDQQGFTHPFDTWPGVSSNLWTVCPIADYGVVAALIGLSDDTCTMVIWRPTA